MCQTLNPFVVKSEIVQTDCSYQIKVPGIALKILIKSYEHMTAFCHIYYAPDMVSLDDVS